jgi:ribonuclease D
MFVCFLKQNGWKNHLRKVNIPLSPEQITVYKRLHAWRDHVARDSDESLRFVLPGHMLVKLASTLPRDTVTLRFLVSFRTLLYFSK